MSIRSNSYKKNIEISYELYREFADEICVPIDDGEFTHHLRYKLYLSKLTYLYNIREQCFYAINGNHKEEATSATSSYTHEDLAIIQNAIDVTKEFLYQTILESVRSSIQSAEKKGYYKLQAG